MSRQRVRVVLAGLLALWTLVMGLLRTSAAASVCCGMSCCPGDEDPDERGERLERAPCCKRTPAEPRSGQAPAPRIDVAVFVVGPAATPKVVLSPPARESLLAQLAAPPPRTTRTIWLEFRSLLI